MVEKGMVSCEDTILNNIVRVGRNEECLTIKCRIFSWLLNAFYQNSLTWKQ